MMLMPTGPPALKLTALADVSGAGEEEKMSIAKFLTVCLASVLLTHMSCDVGSAQADECDVSCRI